jgi:hypothetical protein
MRKTEFGFFAVAVAIALTCTVLLMHSCRQDSPVRDISGSDLVKIATPLGEGGMPNLFVSDSNKVYLSWIAFQDDTTDILMFATLDEDHWSRPRKIASGTDWFVNWADFPALVATGEKEEFLSAHFLQKRTSAVYDYDIRVIQSQDGGEHWGEAFVLHRDSVAAEHGFVTLLPLGGSHVFATWLDGRNTKQTNMTANGHGHSGPMTLRSAVFDAVGHVSDEAELDPMVCDCCQTDAAVIPGGIAVVYRDRSPTEIRDISIVRKVMGTWTPPRPVWQDGWKIAGCPVNGPALAANEEMLAVAWFTMADSLPQVKVAFSNDHGETFMPPVRVDAGSPLGRVDIVMVSDTEAMVCWMEQSSDDAQILTTHVGPKGKSGKDIVIGRTAASRQSGFPVMEKCQDKIIFTWTEVCAEGTQVWTAALTL